MKKSKSVRVRGSRIAVYPGTFDPITLGHLDVLHRACRLFDHVIVAIASGGTKRPLFTLKERLGMIREALVELPNASVEALPGLTVLFAQERGAITLVRGLRKFTDFEYEFDLAHTNRLLAPDIETIVLMPSKDQFCTSSTFVKEIARYQTEKAAQFVPPNVMAWLWKKLGGSPAAVAAGRKNI
ncbi:MAG: pantetheine-phosphate adenylyltransferase [Puniceicoccales bacterium]|jgi:pantetheine-phosphate adenylyltransferase|nr:pantetheine-phosphate adenylyltransferase [Puniceicoccales bacterium]